MFFVSGLGVGNVANAEEFCTDIIYSDWSECDGVQQTREIIGYLPEGCMVDDSVTPYPEIIQFCYIGELCESWDYSEWEGDCEVYPSAGLQRYAIAAYPEGCGSGIPPYEALHEDCPNYGGGMIKGDDSNASDTGMGANSYPTVLMPYLAFGIGVYLVSRKIRSPRAVSA